MDTVFVGEILSSFDAEVSSLVGAVPILVNSAFFGKSPYFQMRLQLILGSFVDRPPVQRWSRGRCPRASWPSAVPSARVEWPGNWRSISCGQGRGASYHDGYYTTAVNPGLVVYFIFGFKSFHCIRIHGDFIIILDLLKMIWFLFPLGQPIVSSFEGRFP